MQSEDWGICLHTYFLLDHGNLPEIWGGSGGLDPVLWAPWAVGGGMEKERKVSVVEVQREGVLLWDDSGRLDGASSHRDVQVLTSVVFIMLKGTSPQSIASRWVSRRAIFTLWASTGKAGMKDTVAGFIIIYNLFASQYHSQVLL